MIEELHLQAQHKAREYMKLVTQAENKGDTARANMYLSESIGYRKAMEFAYEWIKLNKVK